MSDKKSDDFVLSMPNDGADEKHAFLSNASPRGARRPGLVPAPPSQFLASIQTSGGASVLAYCLSSISMTLVNKYVVSGSQWNLHLLYLAIQVRRAKLFIRPAPSNAHTDSPLSEPRR